VAAAMATISGMCRLDSGASQTSAGSHQRASVMISPGIPAGCTLCSSRITVKKAEVEW